MVRPTKVRKLEAEIDAGGNAQAGTKGAGAIDENGRTGREAQAPARSRNYLRTGYRDCRPVDDEGIEGRPVAGDDGEVVAIGVHPFLARQGEVDRIVDQEGIHRSHRDQERIDHPLTHINRLETDDCVVDEQRIHPGCYGPPCGLFATIETGHTGGSQYSQANERICETMRHYS